jgi:hypothetical protein
LGFWPQRHRDRQAGCTVGALAAQQKRRVTASASKRQLSKPNA